MIKNARQLDFISLIKKDGTGVEPVNEEYLKYILEKDLIQNEEFELKRLSIAEKTFIAFSVNTFNVFVVKIKIY